METQEIQISILLPTRKRTALAKRCITSLEDTTKNHSIVEVLVAIDKDDLESIEFFKTFKSKFKIRPIIFEVRQGYKGLHRYMNKMAEEADGKWLFLWNDDAKMMSYNWDVKITEHNGWFGLLRAKCVNMDWHPFALFPIIPKEWIALFGTFSPVTHNDWWTYHVAAACNRMKNISVSIFHDRPDVTGNNYDETFEERSFDNDGKDPTNLDDYVHPQRQQELLEWRQKLLDYVNK